MKLQKLYDNKFYYNKNGLKARGWRDAMIRDLLADIEIKGGRIFKDWGRQGLQTEYHYEAAKVEAIEKTKAFKERKKRRRRLCL